jgi:uncharacterized membrane protein
MPESGETKRVRQPLSLVGLILGTLFFAFSLTPSLVPRPAVAQGVLSGLSLAAGYALGVAALGLWRHLQLPGVPSRAARLATASTALVCLLVAGSFLWKASAWQDAILALMGMEAPASPLRRLFLVGAITLVVFLLILGLARLFRRVFHALSARLHPHVPERVARLLGLAVAAALFWGVIDGVLVRFALRVADRSFQELDALVEDDLSRPSEAGKTGSAGSWVDWNDLGRQGRRFVSGGPTGEDLSRFFGGAREAPIRVYVGLGCADTAEQRARLALQELVRVGGFERELLVVATPTGTGWVDPAAIDTLEYLQRGDVATVAAQYSYLNSPLALLTQGAYGVEMSRALFAEVYRHWRSLPADARPRLFLHGLSLGALNSDLSFDLYDIIDQPFDGALWSGPPFRTETWRQVTAQRDPGSPAWRPTFRGGSVVRFMNQGPHPEPGSRDWGAFRMLFLQYASDPITFFSFESAWREPEWMRAPRGPDVSPDLRWFPVVTMLQLAADMALGSAPPGFGHEFAPADYIDAWVALTEPEGWTEADLERLRSLFRRPQAAD